MQNLLISLSLSTNQQGCDGNRHDQTDSEFIDHILCRAGITGKRGEDGLDKKVVAAVEDGGGPETFGTDRQPGEDEVVGDDHESEADEAIPGGCALVVIAEEQDGEMVGGPHQAANHTNAGEANDLVQLRDEEAAPADFFA